MFEHEIEQGGHIRLWLIGRHRHPALFGRTVENRKIELLIARIERGEEIEHLVDHFRDPRIGFIHLVDTNNRPQPNF